MNLQLRGNRMEPYLQPCAPHLSSRNLFCLLSDFDFGGFNQAQFVIVPKSGNLVVHFLKPSPGAANLYHNVLFDHGNKISYEALYARFAWALIKIIKEDFSSADSAFFKSKDKGPMSAAGSDGEEGQQGRDLSRAPKRKRKRDDSEQDEDGDDSGAYQRSTIHDNSEAPSLSPDSWLSNVVYKIAPGDSQSSIKADIREIEEDLRIAGSHPYLGTCGVTISRFCVDIDHSRLCYTTDRLSISQYFLVP
jgi:hypothetical protein